MPNSEKHPAKKTTSKIDGLLVNTENGAAELLTTNQRLITDGNVDKFIGCIAKHRFWSREEIKIVEA
ncbi:hypothetical protein [Alkaliflexus imshenetskii]|uniref:hypothetical protein n=1 Tax=Alkaliflexus imshenetskii TaxID=286730 RepID=UPI00047B68FE|nr:hypothetical protein [Alkaliflexus imshenetskii]